MGSKTRIMQITSNIVFLIFFFTIYLLLLIYCKSLMASIHDGARSPRKFQLLRAARKTRKTREARETLTARESDHVHIAVCAG